MNHLTWFFNPGEERVTADSPQVTEIISRMFIKSVLSIFLLIIFYQCRPWGWVKHTMMLKVVVFALWLSHCRNLPVIVNRSMSKRYVKYALYLAGLLATRRWQQSALKQRKREQTIIMWTLHLSFERTTTQAGLFTAHMEAHISGSKLDQSTSSCLSTYLLG